MRWADPDRFQLLWLLLPLLLAWGWALRSRARTEAALGDRDALRSLTGDPGRGLRLLRGAFLMAAAALAVLGLARPQSGYRLVTTTSTGADVVIALDLSRSMMARDAHPNRLGAAVREIHTLLASLEGSSVGLVGFAGTGRLLSPLSTDYDGLATIVETLGPDDIDLPGSDIGAGLTLAARYLRRPSDRPRAVVLITDGENLSGDPRAGASAVRQAGARLFTIGLGGTQGATIPLVDSTGAVVGERRGPDGAPVHTRLDEGLLRDLARRAGGRYEHGDGSGQAAARAADGVRSGGNQEVRGQTIRAYDERFSWMAALAGMLLLAERAIPRRRRA